ncbi:DinB family protein [Kribbella sp. NPDC051952]|uniref:DinB family protein n=1 Tax=Kribbella sp. NPDC051952 TaxID=3154851 RepID=UPI0034240076
MDYNTVMELPAAGDEIETLLGVLERNRRTFAWKVGGLDAAGMNAKLGPSTMTLGGLVKHLALVEADMFSHRLLGRDPGAPWNKVDWDSDPDWEWRTAAYDSPDELLKLWRDAVAQSRASVAEALQDGGLDLTGKLVWPDGTSPNLRRLLADMIEEYARHTGHADLIRESIDGLVGEDAPKEVTAP